MEPAIDHIQVTVKNMAAAVEFYDKLMPLLGFRHHLAFRATSRDEVDRLHLEVAAIGAVIVAPPRAYPEYTPAGYYAFFFKDLEGIKYEIVYHSEVP